MKTAISFIFILSALFSSAQQAVTNKISEINPKETALQPLYFLASDELMGRSASRPEANIAARYVSELFRSFGLKEVKETADYFQEFDMILAKSPDKGGFTVGENHFKLMENLLSYEGTDGTITAPVIYLGYGTENELEKADVKGKIVITEFGLNEKIRWGKR